MLKPGMKLCAKMCAFKVLAFASGELGVPLTLPGTNVKKT